MVQLDVDGHALVVGEALGARAAVDSHEEPAAVTQDAPQLGQHHRRGLVPAVDQRIKRDDARADAVGDGQRADVGRDEAQRRIQTAREDHGPLREVDADHRPVGARAEVRHEASDVAGGAAADVEHRPRRAGGPEAAQPLDVPRLARQLVGEVGGVLLGDAIERGANGIGHEPRASCRSWTRASRSWAMRAPQRAMNMSHCVSHGSPCVPRNASARAPVRSAVHHSMSS